MPEKNNIEDNVIYEIANHPDRYINKLEEKKENLKKEIASKLPSNLKPYMEGNTGDIVLFIIAISILILFLKVIHITLRIILNIVGIASIIFVVYLLLKHFIGSG